ncbi:hypothetical protein PIB30_108004, partial [Stylosanthes scabra]|nr:hypothetical protein [Stylosanthes scabra]
QAHIPSHVYSTSNVTLTSPSFTHPRICVESTLAASNFTRPTHRRGSPRICVESSHKSHSRVTSSRATPPSLSQPRIGVEAHAYAWEANNSRLKLMLEKLNVTLSLLASPEPRICAEQQAYAWKASSVSKFSKTHVYASKQGICVEEEFKPSLSYEDPRIGMEVHAYAWKHAGAALKFSKSHAYAWSLTHMRGKQSKTGAESSFS